MEINRVLLIIPPARMQDPPSFTVSIPSIAAALLKEGYYVRILDLEGHKQDLDDRKIEENIAKADFDIFGIGGLITSYRVVKRIIGFIRKHHPKKQVIIGGSLASSIPNQAMNVLGADYVVYGEGDITIVELLKAIQDNSDLSKVQGIYFKDKQGRIHKTDPRPLIRDLDSLPRIPYHLLPMRNYIHQINNIFGLKKSITLFTSRGCVGQCTYCFRVFGKSCYNFNSPEWIIRELKYLKKNFGIKGVYFGDEEFMIKKDRVRRFCRLMMKEKLGIKWVAAARVTTIDYELCKLMKKAGCVYIGLGLESGSQTILDNMKKYVKVEDNKKAIRILRSLKMCHGGTMMFGMVGENDQTIEETIRFCREMELDRNFFFTTPYPGTPIYDDLVAQGKLKPDEKFYESLGDAYDFLINLTDYTDTELKEKKRYLQEQIRIPFPRSLINRIKHYGFSLLWPQFIFSLHSFLFPYKHYEQKYIRKGNKTDK